MKRIVVLGTGTSVGKTHVAFALVKAALSMGKTSIALKPIESGVGLATSDASHLASAGPFHVKQDPPYALNRPISPHRAAWESGLTIDLQAALAWVDAQTVVDVLVVETAGGLLSPLSPPATNLDLAVLLRPTGLVLVAPNRIGVLHDVAACLASLRHRAPRLPAPVVLLQPPAAPDPSSATNQADLLLLGSTPGVHVFPFGPPSTPDVIAAAVSLLEALPS